jgi:CHAT domain-containing protein/tetratricopeptide (TPR) repeat protein
MRALVTAVLFVSFCVVSGAQSSRDPDQVLKEADRFAWLRAWTAAEPRFLEAQRLFAARGDDRNALYAEVSALRGRVPRMSVAEASRRLAAYLEHPLLQSDRRLRLRVLAIKGEVDEDLDPTLSAESWRAVEALADGLGDTAWVNRARGELGLVAFLQGDVDASVIGLGQAVTVAQSNGDVSSLVRWLTLFGHGYVQLGRAAEGLEFYDRALAAASAIPEIQFPVMTHVGRANALIQLGRIDEADAILSRATEAAARAQASGYQAQLVSQRAIIARERNQLSRSLVLFEEATVLAKAAGSSRLVAEIALDTARLHRRLRAARAAERTLREGIFAARAVEEPLLLPRLLAEMADLRSSQRRYGEGAALLDEAADLLSGLFTSASSPWVQSRLVSGMDDVFLTRIRLEGARGANADRMYAAVEDARGRALLQLLVNRPLALQKRPQELVQGERRISELQRLLLQTTDRLTRERLLDQIFAAEELLAPVTTAFFNRSTRTGTRVPPRMAALQSALRSDEVFIEFALADPTSYVLVVTRHNARVQPLPARQAIEGQARALAKAIQDGTPAASVAAALAASLLWPIDELRSFRRALIGPDGSLHGIPFELLPSGPSTLLLESHIVSYVPSGAVLTVLRGTRGGTQGRRTLAVSASPASGGLVSSVKAITRDAYDLDPRQLRPLPSAADEARSVAAIMGQEVSTVLLDGAATEDAFKRQTLTDYDVLHFAVHGIPSVKFPARAALLLQPGGVDDGVLQARETLLLRFNATLVTLSACDTGSGSPHGQDGPASLVRPFLGSGARAVVANLWAADDTFSLAMMRAFYRGLAAGADIGEALRDAKLQMLKSFGTQASPRLWSGLLAYGDTRGSVGRASDSAASRHE